MSIASVEWRDFAAYGHLSSEQDPHHSAVGQPLKNPDSRIVAYPNFAVAVSDSYAT